MRFLLDTHAMIWWLEGDVRLPSASARVLSDEATEIFFSPVSVYEIALKTWIGKLSLQSGSLRELVPTLEQQGIRELPLLHAHALAAGTLDISHRDPFDRLLIAQALTEDLILISNEALFDNAGVERLWG